MPRTGQKPQAKEDSQETVSQARPKGKGRRNVQRGKAKNPQVPETAQRQESPGLKEGQGKDGEHAEADPFAEVDELPEQLLRSFFSENIGTQDFVGLMRRFCNAPDKSLKRIYELVITIMLDDLQSFPYWPAKELMMMGELLGQFVRWDLIPEGGPLQVALCCILTALKEPPASLLHRFGKRALEQFLCRVTDHEVAALICGQVQPSRPPKQEAKQEDPRLPFNPLLLQKQFPPWRLLQPGLGPNQNLLLRMMVPQIPLVSRENGRKGPEVPKASQLGVPKAPSRAAASKQGLSKEPDKDKREREVKSKKRSSGKNKKATETGPPMRPLVLPDFIEVDMESMEFQLSADDLLDDLLDLQA